MLSRLRFTPTPLASLARTIPAAILVLVLLSGVAPLNALSSSHQCRMACCAGKTPHAEGSCSVAFADENQAESTGEQGEEHSAHHPVQDISGAASETVAPSHHDEAKHQLAHHSSPSKKSSQTPRVASQVLTTPCSPECAAVVSASTQLRGQRNAAAISIAGNPRPPTLVLFKKEVSNLLLPSSEKRRQSAPRAPPLSLINLSA